MRGASEQEGPGEIERSTRSNPDETTPQALESLGDPSVGPSPSPNEVVGKARYHQVFRSLFELPAEPPTLGRYVVLGTLGRGGMGTVLEAFDRTLDRKVAVKVLHQGLDSRYTERLVREARAMAKLSHPNVVQVYEAGRVEDRVFVAMELVKGQTLRQWIRREPPPPWRECVAMFVALGTGLAAAHARGLVHRDFKPTNAIVDEEGRPRVLDFGLVRRVDEADSDVSPAKPAPEAPASPGQTSLTTSGVMLGTVGYMPPEQMSGGEADARSDQFSFCVALYEAVYGARPFVDTTATALMESMRRGPPTPEPDGSKVPAGLRRVLLRGLAFEPSQRWPSMEALLGELRRLVAPRRGRWLVLGMTAGLSVVGAGLGVEQYASWVSRCTGAAARLTGIWDQARQREVKASILGTGTAYAADTWERVRSRLDDYAAAWADKHTEICEATRVTQEQTEEHMGLRMRCLEAQRIDLRATVTVLARGHGRAVERAVELSSDLPRPTRCDDVEVLQLALPPPEDPAVAAQVEAVRERLAEVRALNGAGAYEPALSESQAAMDRAEALEYAPLLAEAQLLRGIAHMHTNQYEPAVQDVEQAYARATEIGHERVASTAPRVLVFLVGVRQEQHEAALQWSKVALPMSRRPGAAPDEEAKALHHTARVLRSQGKLEDALAHAQRALELRVQRLGPDHLDVADSLETVGVTLDRQGKRDEGLRHLRRALEIKQQALGMQHPTVGMTLANLAGMYKDRDELEQAMELYRRALPIFEALGPRDLRVGWLLNDIGVTLKLQGKLEEALEHYERALSIKQEHLGPRHPDVSMTLDNMGTVLVRLGQYEQARDRYERALTGMEQTVGPDHPSVAYPLLGLSGIMLEQGDREAAQAYAERAVSVREQGEVSPDLLAEARFNLALTLGPEPTQRSRARTLAEQARAGYLAAGPGEARWLVEVEQWLAEHPLE